MSNTNTFRKLLEPLQIRHIKFRNRLVKTPQDMGYANIDGSVSQRNLDFYEAVARGGIGAIIVEHAYVDSSLSSRDLMISVADDKFIPGLTKLTEVVHRYNCPVIQQINHLGPQYNSKSSGPIAVSASTLNEDYMKKTFAGKTYNLKALTIPEIEEIIEKFVRAAERVQKAGYDGVEIHADHAYLLNSFLSRVWNKREDEYGIQTLENRARFAVAVLRAVRECMGQDFVIGIKLNGVEYGAEEGTTSLESQHFARLFEDAGADYINVTGDGYGSSYYRVSLPDQLFYPEPPRPMALGLNKRSLSSGIFVPQAAAIKGVVSVPVITVGRLDHVLGEKLLRKGLVDAIALGRRLFADPELPNKVAQGKLDDIRPCIACGTCADLYTRNFSVACSVNATLGKERESEIRPAEKRKRIVIVGGGPAGMEAARVAALRGHEVTLFEKEPRVGGLLSLASLIKGIDIFDLQSLVKYQYGQVTRLGVKIRLSEEFTPEQCEKIKPDVVILATGGVSDKLEIPGIDNHNVITSEELQRRVKFYLRLLGPKLMGRLTKYWLPIGKRVVIVGGQIHGCEVAEFLVKRNRTVTIVESTDQLGTGIPEIPHRRALLKWLDQKGVATLTQVKYKEITDAGLIVITKEGIERTIGGDTILVTIPPKPNPGLIKTLEGKVPEVYSIGDGRQPGLIMDAIADGFQTGRTIGFIPQCC